MGLREHRVRMDEVRQSAAEAQTKADLFWAEADKRLALHRAKVEHKPLPPEEPEK